MKPIRMFGLVVLAALVATVVAGGGSAMAESTALCNIDPGTGAKEICPAGKLVTHLHAQTAIGNKAIILTNVGNVECDLLYLGEVGPLASPQVIEGNFTYGNCTNGCEVTEESEVSTFKLLKKSHETADLFLTGKMRVECGILLECVFASENMKGLAKGALLPFTGAEEAFEQDELKKVEGFFCPEKAKLDFLILSLSSIYIAG
jgi:hypothetical protein